MLKIKFKYKDILSKGERRYQECQTSSMEEFMKIYGLNEADVIDYKVLEVKEVE